MKVLKEHVTHPDTSFRFLHIVTPVFDGDWHRHAEIELTWIEYGEGVRFVGDNASRFAGGDMVLLGPQVSHVWKGIALPDAQSSVAWVVQFPLTLLEQSGLPELASLKLLIARADVGLQITGDTQQQVSALIREMQALSPLHRLSRLIEILACLQSGVADCQPISATPASYQADSQPKRRIQAVMAYIQQHIHQTLSVTDVARVSHITPAAFSRFFRRETGKNFSDYVNDVRCQTACLLLRSSDTPVSRIAEACGFGTLSNFNRQFLSRVGQTPRDYRRAAMRN